MASHSPGRYLRSHTVQSLGPRQMSGLVFNYVWKFKQSNEGHFLVRRDCEEKTWSSHPQGFPYPVKVILFLLQVKIKWLWGSVSEQFGEKWNWIKISLPVEFCGPFVGNLADFTYEAVLLIHLTKCGNCPICYFNKCKSSTDRVQVFIFLEQVFGI